MTFNSLIMTFYSLVRRHGVNSPVRRYRAVIFLFILSFIVIVSILSPVMPIFGKPTTTVSNNIIQFTGALTSNLFAAILWYTLLKKHEQSSRLDPLLKAFHFLHNKEDELYIILASLPSAGGHQTTGIGEARAMGGLFR